MFIDFCINKLHLWGKSEVLKGKWKVLDFIDLKLTYRSKSKAHLQRVKHIAIFSGQPFALLMVFLLLGSFAFFSFLHTMKMKMFVDCEINYICLEI